MSFGQTACAVAGLVTVAVMIGVTVPFSLWLQVVAVTLVATIGPVVLVRHLNAPAAGMRLLLVSAVLMPVEIVAGDATATGPGGTFSLCFLLTAFLIGTWLLRSLVVRRAIRIDASSITVITLIFMAVAVLSFVVGQYPWFPTDGAPMRAQLGGLSLFLLSGGVLLIIAHETRSLAHLAQLTAWFIGLGGLTVASMLVPGTQFAYGQIKVLTHGSIGSLFFVWLVAMSAAQGLWNTNLRPALRAVALAIAALVLFRGVFLTSSWVSGWLPPVIALGVLLVFRFPRLVTMSALVLSVPTILAAGLLWERLMANESWSWMTRVEALRVMEQIVLREPLLGLGPANYHFYTYLYPLLGYHIVFNSHNNYIDLLAQSGVVGLLVFCWLAFEVLRLAYRLFRSSGDGFSRAYAAGTFAGVVASLVAGFLADWIVPFVYNVGIAGFRSSLLFWFFIGGLVVLRRFTIAATASESIVPVRQPRLAVSRA